MSNEIISADEARALLNGASDFEAIDPGSYCGGSVVECSLDGECHGDHPSGRISALRLDAGEEFEVLYFSEEADAKLAGAAPDLARAVIALTASRDDAADAFDHLVARVWRAATGDTHEGPASVEALLAEVRRLRTDNANLDDAAKGALDDLARVRAELDTYQKTVRTVLDIGEMLRDENTRLTKGALALRDRLETLEGQCRELHRALATRKARIARQRRDAERFRVERNDTRAALRANLRCDECEDLATRTHAATARFGCDAHGVGEGWSDTTHAAAVRAAVLR